MTNRQLKRRIRQAFEHATPNLAETAQKHVPLSTASSKKEDDKTIKTPIQFRAIATLVACCLVVLLLAGLIPAINPFNNSTNTGPVPTDPGDLGDAPGPNVAVDPTETDCVEPTDATDPVSTDPLNTEGPPLDDTTTLPTVDEQEALYIALNSAGIKKDQAELLSVRKASPLGMPCYQILFYNGEHYYNYTVTEIFGSILRGSKAYRDPLDYLHDGEFDGAQLGADEALEIAIQDPMYKDSLVYLYTSGPYNNTDLGDNAYSYYEVYFKGDTRGDQLYLFRICREHKTVQDVLIYCQDESVFKQPVSVIPPDGKIGKDNAIMVALTQSGLNADELEALGCEEDDNWYDVTFYYDSYKWHYYVHKYSMELLSVEKIPLDN